MSNAMDDQLPYYEIDEFDKFIRPFNDPNTIRDQLRHLSNNLTIKSLRFIINSPIDLEKLTAGISLYNKEPAYPNAKLENLEGRRTKINGMKRNITLAEVSYERSDKFRFNSDN